MDVSTINQFKARLDKFWMHQDVLYDYTADLTGIGDRSQRCVVLYVVVLNRCGHWGVNICVRTCSLSWVELRWGNWWWLRCVGAIGRSWFEATSFLRGGTRTDSNGHKTTNWHQYLAPDMPICRYQLLICYHLSGRSPIYSYNYRSAILPVHYSVHANMATTLSTAFSQVRATELPSLLAA